MNSKAPSLPIRLGAIGCGNRLQNVLKLLIEQRSSIKVTAAYDPYSPAHDQLDQIVGTPVTRHVSWQSLIASDEVDWVAIGSPNRFHAEQVIAALEAGKHVFCEKPLAIDMESCLRVRDAVRSSGRHFVFGLVLRYSPHYQKLRELCKNGRIGRLISFEFNETLGLSHGGYIFGNWRRKTSEAGSHILEKTCHDLDLANWMVGSIPIKVASFGGRNFFVPSNASLAKNAGIADNGRPVFQSWDDPHNVDPFSGEADINDNQVVILEYANGVRATFHTNIATTLPERRFYLCGTEGTLRSDVMTGDITIKRIEGAPAETDTGVSGGHGGGDIVMARHLAATMTKGTPPLAGIDEALRSAIVAFGIDEAAATDRVVDLNPLWIQAGVL